MFGKMDESAVKFECRSSTTIHPTGSKSVPTKCFERIARIMEVLVSVESDGKKLSLFFIFQGSPNDKIESN